MRKSTLAQDEPAVVEAVLVWCEMRVARETQVSFQQFYADVLKGRLGTRYGAGSIQEFMRRNHGDLYRRAASGS